MKISSVFLCNAPDLALTLFETHSENSECVSNKVRIKSRNFGESIKHLDQSQTLKIEKALISGDPSESTMVNLTFDV